jgi:crooked neck
MSGLLQHVKVWILYALSESEPIPVSRAMREEEEEEEGDEQAEPRTLSGDPVLAGV